MTAPNVAPAPAPGQSVLMLSARFGRDLPTIPSGLVWRVYSDKTDAKGAPRLVKEDRGATPNVMLTPGNYVVHVSLGLASAMRQVSVRDTSRETFEIPRAAFVSKAASAPAAFQPVR